MAVISVHLMNMHRVVTEVMTFVVVCVPSCLFILFIHLVYKAAENSNGSGSI